MRNTSELELAGAPHDSLTHRERLLSLLLAVDRKRRQTTETIAARGEWDGPIPLSYAQERLWFLDQLGLVGTAYNVPMALRLEGNLNVKALERSFAELVRRHETLRTRFGVQDGVPHQLIDPPGIFELRQADLSHVADPAQRQQQVREWVQREQLRRFDLCKEHQLRVVLLRLGGDEHVLLLTIHHVACDGWSLGVLHRELGALYSAYSQEQPSLLPELPVQYADYAIWQRAWMQGEVLRDQLGYWRERLLGAPPQVELPTDRPRPAVESFKGTKLRIDLPTTLAQALKELARRERATLFMVFLAAYQVLLSRWSGQRDIVVGAPIAGRGNREVEELIGFFVNTLALRTHVSDDLTFRQLLDRVKEVTLGAYTYQDLPFEALVKELRPERDLARHPIFQVAVVLRNYAEERVEVPGLTWTWTEVESETAHFDMTLYLNETSDGFSGSFEYATDLFDEQTIAQMAGNFRVMLEGIVADPDCPIQQLPMLTTAEREQMLHGFNDTAVSHARKRLLHELFEAQVERTPEAVAVLCGGRQLTYAQLNRRANQLAHALVAHGVRPDARVGLYVDRSVELIVGLLGILKAGGAYVPLDVTYPAERLAYMLRDSAPVVLLTQERLKETLPASGARVIALDADENDIGREPDGNLDALQLGLRPQHLAYVIYTSGSTGTPKGVMVAHRNVVNLVHWHCAAFHLREGDRCSCVAAVGFDAAGWEIWPSLSIGASLMLASPKSIGDVEALLVWWAGQPLDISFLPTPVAELAFSRNIRNEKLRTLLVGGDRLRHHAASPSSMLINNYGPTESTVVATSGCIHDGAALHIGRPISNTQIYILDGHLQPVPIGVAGEIYIGGLGVARGYLNRPELTAERFIADPFSADVEARLYRSGDLGRWRRDGTIDFLGRSDHQVKLRGFRIELGEIEVQLARHHQVKEAVVLAREDVPGGKRLVAYITLRGGDDLIVEDLRAQLEAVLPEYMIPSAFVVLESFPLTANGKLDRSALPAPGIGAYANHEYEAPRGEVEEVIAGIWRELLLIDPVGREDNFFSLGGHSLLVLKAVFKINESFGCTLSVRDVYKSPTLRELATRIDGSTIEDDLVDLEREASLDEKIVAKTGLRRIPAEAVMLTGASGFVGRFLLAQLLVDTDATIYCLVRAPSQHEASFRLRTTLTKWDLWRDEFEPRIVAIPGDLRLPCLGVDELTYRLLSQRIDTIYHCATSMNHLETYAMARSVNVESAKELLKLATNHKPKLINCISTLGIFSASAVRTTRVVDEMSRIDQERHSASRGYSASKWVSEKIFMTADERGIPCNIFRLGLVWADTKQGRYDELQREYRIFKSCLLAGYGIKNYRYEMAPAPVDYVARSVVFLANQHRDGHGIFHIASSHGAVEDLFERCNENAGTSLQLMPLYEWIGEIKRLHKAGWSLPVVPLIEFSFNMDEESFYEHERRARLARVRIDGERTYRELEHAGIVAPGLSDDLLRVSVESMLSRDAELQELIVSKSHPMAMKRGPVPQEAPFEA